MTQNIDFYDDGRIYQSYTSMREDVTIGNNMDIRLKLIYSGFRK